MKWLVGMVIAGLLLICISSRMRIVELEREQRHIEQLDQRCSNMELTLYGSCGGVWAPGTPELRKLEYRVTDIETTVKRRLKEKQ